MAMLTFDSIPQARVVRKGGHVFAPPPAPPNHEPNALREHARTVLAVALGMWPLTGVVLLAVGLLIMVGNNGAP
jgi:hypothetical protein